MSDDPAARYRAGAVLERAAKKQLESDGYYVVKSGGSKGPADLVALKFGEILLVQCKVAGRISKAEREELCDLADRTVAVPLVCQWHKPATGPRVPRFFRAWPGLGLEAWTADHGLQPSVRIPAARMKFTGPDLSFIEGHS